MWVYRVQLSTITAVQNDVFCVCSDCKSSRVSYRLGDDAQCLHFEAYLLSKCDNKLNAMRTTKLTSTSATVDNDGRGFVVHEGDLLRIASGTESLSLRQMTHKWLRIQSGRPHLVCDLQRIRRCWHLQGGVDVGTRYQGRHGAVD
jgi:hypothetical protein